MGCGLSSADEVECDGNCVNIDHMGYFMNNKTFSLELNSIYQKITYKNKNKLFPFTRG